MFKVFQLT